MLKSTKFAAMPFAVRWGQQITKAIVEESRRAYDRNGAPVDRSYTCAFTNVSEPYYVIESGTRTTTNVAVSMAGTVTLRKHQVYASGTVLFQTVGLVKQAVERTLELSKNTRSKQYAILARRKAQLASVPDDTLTQIVMVSDSGVYIALRPGAFTNLKNVNNDSALLAQALTAIRGSGWKYTQAGQDFTNDFIQRWQADVLFVKVEDFLDTLTVGTTVRKEDMDFTRIPSVAFLFNTLRGLSAGDIGADDYLDAYAGTISLISANARAIFGAAMPEVSPFDQPLHLLEAVKRLDPTYTIPPDSVVHFLCRLARDRYSSELNSASSDTQIGPTELDIGICLYDPKATITVEGQTLKVVNEGVSMSCPCPADLTSEHVSQLRQSLMQATLNAGPYVFAEADNAKLVIAKWVAPLKLMISPTLEII